MTPQDFINPIRPTQQYIEHDPRYLYWIKEGKIMLGPVAEVRGADPDSFVFYLGSFAKDSKYCYCQGSRLKGANPERFQVLNNTYCKDENNVWCLGGEIKDVDATSFEVCDNGIYYHHNSSHPYPYGFGKDKNRVFYYDFNGKACWVRKADPNTFKSLNDGCYGMDENSVFCGERLLTKADVHSWKKLGRHYSKDKSKVFYSDRLMKEADCESFRVIRSKNDNVTPLARDANHFYWTDHIVDYCEVGARIWVKDAVPDVPGDMPPIISRLEP